MWRFLKTLCLWLVFGFAVNVGVAWACALWGLLPVASAYTKTSFASLGSAIRPPPGLSVSETGYVRKGWTLEEWQFNNVSGVIRVCRVGWPLHSLEFDVFFRRGGTSAQNYNETHHGLVFSDWLRPKSLRVRDRNLEYLPLKPIVLGTIINTLVFAVCLWFLFTLCMGIRKRRWTLRCLCPNCRYPVSGLYICPECGIQVYPVPVE